MRKMALAALVAVFAVGSTIEIALAQDTCRSQAIGKDGKPLTGAAPTSFMKNVQKTLARQRQSTKPVKSSPGLQKLAL